MVNLLSDDNVLELINSYPEENRKLLSKQIFEINSMIIENYEIYCSDIKVRSVIDNFLALILNGKFL